MMSRVVALLLVPSLACASFEHEIVDPVHPSLAAGTVELTRFEGQPATTPPPAPAPSSSTPPTAAPPPAPAPGTTTTPQPSSGSTEIPPPATSDPTARPQPAPPGASPAQMEDGEATVGPVEGQPEPQKAQRARNGVFWTGVVLTALGGAGVIAFGVGGRVTQSQLAKGYDDTSLTRAEESKLRDRGGAFNDGAAVSAAVGILGIAMFSIALGVDYIRCGTLTTKRRKDCVPRPRKR
jgi:hypothetical protein